MNAAVLLRLGRVSNLPTVWTNLLAAVVLAGGAVSDGRILPLLAAMSLFYIGGMYLNAVSYTHLTLPTIYSV